MSRAELHIDDLCLSRAGKEVLRGVSLRVPPGEVTALLGPNGAGKSSLTLAIAGALKASAGSIRVGEAELLGRRPEAIRRAGVAVVPEGRRLLGALSVEENLRTATYTMRKDEAAAGMESALALFPELKKRWRSPARLLSGGEQQMVALAQALVSRPQVVVVDEMSLGLAPIVVGRLEPAIRAVAESGIGVLLIEQFAHVALALSRRAYILYHGEITFKGEATELVEQPDLLDAAYRLGASEAGI